jgi:hypothetical protein
MRELCVSLIQRCGRNFNRAGDDRIARRRRSGEGRPAGERRGAADQGRDE